MKTKVELLNQYGMATQDTIRGFFPLEDNQVLDFYMELENIDVEDGLNVGECCIMSLDEYFRTNWSDDQEVMEEFKKDYSAAKKLSIDSLNNLIINDEADGVFQLYQENIGHYIFSVRNTKLEIYLIDGLIEGNFIAKLIGGIKHD